MLRVVLPYAKRVLLPLVLRTPSAGGGFVRLGSAYGGWWVPEEIVQPGAIAYCAGAGEDISFDLALRQRGVEVVTFDPTPRAIKHVQENGNGLQFEPIGWWDEPGELRFFSPADENHVSHSAVNLQQTETFFLAPVDTVANIARRLGHSHIDILKMDIEGAEFRVLNSLLRDDVLPTVLAVEFDVHSLRRISSAAKKLRHAGYRSRKAEGWNVTFVRR